MVARSPSGTPSTRDVSPTRLFERLRSLNWVQLYGQSPAKGAIGSIAVRGSLGCGRFACGVDPGDGSVLNADDAIAGRGAIGKIEIRGTADDLIIAATTLPPSARIGGVIVRTELDTRFMWLDDSELPG
jgi:hypothetical protein